MEGRGDEGEWKFLANNGNGERIQIEIAPCGRLLGRGTKLGQTTWMLFSSSRDFFSSQRERAGSQNKAFVKVMSRNSFEQISRSGTMSLLCMFPVFFFFFFSFPFSVLFLLHRGDKVPLETVSIMFGVRFNIIVKTRLDKDSFVAKITNEILCLIRTKKVSLENTAYDLYRLTSAKKRGRRRARAFLPVDSTQNYIFSRELVFADRNSWSLSLVRNIRERERDWW